MGSSRGGLSVEEEEKGEGEWEDEVCCVFSRIDLRFDRRARRWSVFRDRDRDYKAATC